MAPMRTLFSVPLTSLFAFALGLLRVYIIMLSLLSFVLAGSAMAGMAGLVVATSASRDDEPADAANKSDAATAQQPTEEAKDKLEPVVKPEPVVEVEPYAPSAVKPEPVVEVEPYAPEPLVLAGAPGNVSAPQQDVEAEPNGQGGVTLDNTFETTVFAGRVATLDLNDPEVRSVEVVSDPSHGNVTVNPDNTLALVLSDTQSTEDVSFSVRLSYADGSVQDETIEVEVVEGTHGAGWGMGNFYMLQTDEDDRVVVEHGENHQKLHISGSEDALTINDIAAIEGLDPSEIGWKFFRDNPEYGTSSDEPLAQDAGKKAWEALMNDSEPSSDWMLLERGYEYGDLGRVITAQSQGESELHPIYISAYGEGDAPKVASSFSTVKAGAENIVIQGLDFEANVTMLNGKNVIMDDISVTNGPMNIQKIDGFTLRNSDVVDVTQDAPNNGEFWAPHLDRESGIYISNASNVLLEQNFFDHNGWAEGYDPAGSADQGQPPSMFSHNVYIQSENEDVTFRDNIIMRAAATGVQMRAGGFIEDNTIIDNNGAIMFAGGGDKFDGNYTLFTDNVITSGAHKETDKGQGALTKGVTDAADMSTLVDNIITHLADPNNPAERIAKYDGQNPYSESETAYYDDTIVHNWSKEIDDPIDDRNLNTEGLDYDVLNETTIQNFTAQLLGKETATIDDLGNYLRAQADGAFDDVVDADLINAFFQSGFGLDTTLRDTAETLRFVPSDLGDGMRWDNRLNWDTNDLPGTQDGDSVDLADNWVYYGGTTTVENLDFGDGGKLFVNHGYLEVEGTLEMENEGGTLTLDSSGQFWTAGYTGDSQFTVEADGGRFANTGTFDAPVDMSLSDNAQAILATDGASFRLGAESSLDLIGGDIKVGFDGDSDGTATLHLERGSNLNFFAEDEEVAEISEFYSGHFASPGETVTSGINLGDANLSIDLNTLAGGSTHRLMSADEIIGNFASIELLGLGASQDASIVIDYETDEVTLNIGEDGKGAGRQTLYTNGDATVDFDSADLWTALTAGQGTYSDEPQTAMDEDDQLVGD